MKAITNGVRTVLALTMTFTLGLALPACSSGGGGGSSTEGDAAGQAEATDGATDAQESNEPEETGVWVLTSYNADSNSTYVFDGSEYTSIHTSHTDIELDGEGNAIQSVQTYSNADSTDSKTSSSTTHSTKTVSTYDEDGYIVKKEEYDEATQGEGGSIVTQYEGEDYEVGVTTYFDKDGNEVTEEEYYQVVGFQDEPRDTTSYEYERNDKGQVTKVTEESTISSNLSNVSTEYTYNDEGYIVKSVYSYTDTYEGYEGVDSYVHDVVSTYEYDSSGKTASYTSVTSDHESGEVISSSTTEYKDGNAVSGENRSNDLSTGEETVSKVTYENEFDDDGKLTKQTRTTSDGEKTTYTSVTEYVYDNNGNVVKESRTETGEDGSSYSATTTYEHTYIENPSTYLKIKKHLPL